MVAPDRAFELNVAVAYNQGWGNLTDSVSIAGERKVQDVAGAGLALELDLGYRTSPRFAAGVYGTLAFFSNQTDVSGTGVRSLTADSRACGTRSLFERSVRGSPWAPGTARAGSSRMLATIHCDRVGSSGVSSLEPIFACRERPPCSVRGFRNQRHVQRDVAQLRLPQSRRTAGVCVFHRRRSGEVRRRRDLCDVFRRNSGWHSMRQCLCASVTSSR